MKFLRFFAIFLFVFILFGRLVGVNAKEVMTSPSPTPVPQVSSFELFWPMVAGKTMQSKIYFLKTLKENVRGFLVFGSAQKADYDVFLGVKRMLEAEVLVRGNVSDLANKTLDSALSDFNKANSNINSAKSSSDVTQGVKNSINMRVGNLKKFVESLMRERSDYKDKLQKIQDSLNSISV